MHAPFETLTYLLTARQQLEGQVRGVPFVDREFSSVYGLCLNQPLEAYTLQASEVDSLYEVPLDELIALFRGETHVIQAVGVQAVQSASNQVDQSNGNSVPLPVQARHIREIQAAKFVPHGTEYYIDVLEALYNIPKDRSNPV